MSVWVQRRLLFALGSGEYTLTTANWVKKCRTRGITILKLLNPWGKSTSTCRRCADEDEGEGEDESECGTRAK